jgi:hypothetical protein
LIIVASRLLFHFLLLRENFMTLSHHKSLAVLIPLAPEGDASGGAIVPFLNIDSIAAIGSRVGTYRRVRGWTQSRLAREASVQVADVRLAERKPEQAPVELFLVLAKALGVEIHDLAEESLIEISPD